LSNITTLKQDLEHVLKTGEGWTKEIEGWMAQDIQKTISRQMNRNEDYKPYLRMSSLGKPCERQLWYEFHSKLKPEPLQASTKAKFIFGDMIESFLIALVMASGHKVEGLQELVEIDGIKGSRDCIIDGMQFDIKSAATQSFDKFKQGQLKGYWKKSRKKDEPDVWIPAMEADPFGYISQNSSYLFASLDDPRITHKSEVGFLAFDKQFGHIVVDIYDVSDQLKTKRQEIQSKKDLIKSDTPPDRITWGTELKSTKDKKPDPNGNVGLKAPCSYCNYKKECYPGLRTFISSKGPEYLVKVVKEPKMMEVT